MWYFKSSTRQCEQFTYGGCEGNSNRFQSVEDCERTCHPYIDPNGTENYQVLYEIKIKNAYSFVSVANKIDEDTKLTKPSENSQPDVCEAGKLRCNQLLEEPTRCPYGLEQWVNNFGCEDCRCYNPCSPGIDQKSVCPADYQCTVEAVIIENGEQKYKPSCRPGIHIVKIYKIQLG